MRPIHIAFLDKPRPVVILTRELLVGRMKKVTIAPITSTIRGIATEVAVGPANGLDRASVIACDNITTVDFTTLGDNVGQLLPRQEHELAMAISIAFDLKPTI
jgi:mRNA interferase MazF